MSDIDIEITFDGTHGGTYYTTANTVEYINKEDMSSTYSGTIYLYKNKQGTSRGEYITLQAGYYPQWHSSSNYNTEYITNVSNVEFNALGEMYRTLPYIDVGFKLILIIFALIAMIKK